MFGSDPEANSGKAADMKKFKVQSPNNKLPDKKRMPPAENKLYHIGINDPSINSRSFEFRIAYRRSQHKVVLISRPFDYECGEGVFMRLRPQEEFPLNFGTVV